MPKLIKNAEIVSNTWTIVAKDQGLEDALANPADALIIPVQTWLENKKALTDSSKKIAVWLDCDETAEMIADDLADLNLIALNFPAFTDGRSYSTATKLRQHYNYTGELRAIGDILRDQLTFLKRCGFDSFDVSDDVKEADALGAFEDFTENYQSTVEKTEPLFRRR
jgi:uncharacterized protein (DUF934 family)